MSQLPHVFVPSQQAVQNTMCAHPGGPIELYLIASNMETDMKLDARLASTGCSPVLSPSPEALALKQDAKQKQAKQFPFSVPLLINPLHSPRPMEVDEPDTVKKEGSRA